MSEQPAASVARPRNRLLAFLLNLFLAPTGYVYAGEIPLAIAYVVFIIAAAAGATWWTWVNPPGVYTLPFMRGDSIGWVGWLLVNAPIAIAVAIHAAIVAGRLRPSTRAPAFRWLVAIALFLTPLILATLSRTFAPFAAYTVSSDSMQPTLAKGEIVLGTGARSSCGNAVVRAGDVVVFQRSDQPGYRFLQRAIAAPGSTVAINRGQLSIDGQPIRTESLGAQQMEFAEDMVQPTWMFREHVGAGPGYRTAVAEPGGSFETISAFRVPEGSWFILGDNRDNAMDSRHLGPIKQQDICGVAIRVLWSKTASDIGRRP
jgi:signal peptidase I